MADTIRTGIVGATLTQGGSGWGANAHVPALHLLPDYTLQAVCTAHEDTAQTSKAKFDAVHAFHDIDAMARHPEIEPARIASAVRLMNRITYAALATIVFGFLAAEIANYSGETEVSRSIESARETFRDLSARLGER